MRAVLLIPVALLLSGCVAKAAWDVATLPVKAVSRTVDAVTTSQSEADEKRGRELREADERRGREAREAARRAERECRDARREAQRRGLTPPDC